VSSTPDMDVSPVIDVSYSLIIADRWLMGIFAR
jgi:hypothetical protein